MMEDESNEQQPMYIDLLKSEDKKQYEQLRSVLGAPDHRYNRNKRIVTFTDMLEQIKTFCIRHDGDDWKRFLVCGICWLNNDIAINTRQLRILLGKSKSTINGAFSKMNYETLPFRNHDSGLQDKIPFLKGNFNEARQWTVRRLTSLCISDSPSNDQTPVPSSPEPTPVKRTKHASKTKDDQVLVFPEQDFAMSFSLDDSNIPNDILDTMPFSYSNDEDFDQIETYSKAELETEMPYNEYMHDITFMY